MALESHAGAPPESRTNLEAVAPMGELPVMPPALESDATGAPEPGAPIAPASAPPPPANQIAVHLARHAATGDSIVVSLSPEELGRVEIEIELDGDGRARAHVAAELPMTLELIQRDAAVLERALEAAGVDLAPDALTFDLRRDGQSPQHGRAAGLPTWTAPGRSAEPELVIEPTRHSSRLLDLRV
jgi:flagellar hook-length control protein FliK